ncbi:XRE family transcriptional regulator [Nocardioides oleivorans]|uniref:XRE family transcriptional regulator n=1 Tax=Nocardioides oleivorans TaxID=273676 RepID=A0A4Q2S0Y4_9ACTN|nr:helix-turn-helix transcriptional regulator [Nocardioides oleivorans]RYB95290.1 XRE family transcriptional regulator [Nocardioides oleivorans]
MGHARLAWFTSKQEWTKDVDDWSLDEWEWFWMGPFDGGIPGMVRRVRRILDVSQRGLAELIGVSQSVVARWETGRTSPRSSVMADLLRRARLTVTVTDDDDQEVQPMRDDGVRQVHGSRFPAHVDLRVTGWWVPANVESTMVEYYQWKRRSKEARDPSVRYQRARWRRRLERELRGTPDDHPSVEQCAAEAEHLDEVREQRRLPRAAA